MIQCLDFCAKSNCVASRNNSLAVQLCPADNRLGSPELTNAKVETRPTHLGALDVPNAEVGIVLGLIKRILVWFHRLAVNLFADGEDFFQITIFLKTLYYL